MGRKQTPGMQKRKGIWHIDKQIFGKRICESCGTSNLQEAELILAKRIDELRQVVKFGARPKYIFREAATKYLLENTHLAKIGDYARLLGYLDPYIGHLPLVKVHLGTLQPYIDHKRKVDGVKNKTINNALSLVRRILNLSARLWRDDNGLTWLETMPLIQMLPSTDARKPYPLTWTEQRTLQRELPDHLANMMLFKINTGTREQEVCKLRWDWEVEVPELNTSVFLIPAEFVKNRDDRLVVLNKVAMSVVESQRGNHTEFVFTSKGKPIGDINNTGWQRSRLRAAMQLIKQDYLCESLKECVYRDDKGITAKITSVKSGIAEEIIYTLDDYEVERKEKGLNKLMNFEKKQRGLLQTIRYKALRYFIDQYWPSYSAFSRVRVHDLKHTFGRRLRAAGVSNETRKVLLGHRNGDITTHYSEVELTELIEAVQKVSDQGSRKSPALIVLRRKSG